MAIFKHIHTSPATKTNFKIEINVDGGPFEGGLKAFYDCPRFSYRDVSFRLFRMEEIVARDPNQVAAVIGHKAHKLVPDENGRAIKDMIIEELDDKIAFEEKHLRDVQSQIAQVSAVIARLTLEHPEQRAGGKALGTTELRYLEDYVMSSLAHSNQYLKDNLATEKAVLNMLQNGYFNV